MLVNLLMCQSGQVCVRHQDVMDQAMSMDDLHLTEGTVELEVYFESHN